MSQIEKTVGELRAMAAGVERAHADIGAADARAQEITAQAVRSGFAGIATGLAQVRQSLAEIRGRTAGIAVSTTEAITTAGSAVGELSPQQTITVLAPAQQALSAAMEKIVATIHKLAETRRMTEAVLRGGQPGPMLTALDSIGQVLEMVAQRGTVAGQSLNEAIAQARQVGDRGN